MHRLLCSTLPTKIEDNSNMAVQNPTQFSPTMMSTHFTLGGDHYKIEWYVECYWLTMSQRKWQGGEGGGEVTPMMRVRIAATRGAPRKMRTERATVQNPIWKGSAGSRNWRDTTCIHKGITLGLGGKVTAQHSCSLHTAY